MSINCVRNFWGFLKTSSPFVIRGDFLNYPPPFLTNKKIVIFFNFFWKILIFLKIEIWNKYTWYILLGSTNMIICYFLSNSPFPLSGSRDQWKPPKMWAWFKCIWKINQRPFYNKLWRLSSSINFIPFVKFPAAFKSLHFFIFTSDLNIVQLSFAFIAEQKDSCLFTIWVFFLSTASIFLQFYRV